MAILNLEKDPVKGRLLLLEMIGYWELRSFDATEALDRLQGKAFGEDWSAQTWRAFVRHQLDQVDYAAEKLASVLVEYNQFLRKEEEDLAYGI